MVYNKARARATKQTDELTSCPVAEKDHKYPSRWKEWTTKTIKQTNKHHYSGNYNGYFVTFSEFWDTFSSHFLVSFFIFMNRTFARYSFLFIKTLTSLITEFNVKNKSMLLTDRKLHVWSRVSQTSTVHRSLYNYHCCLITRRQLPVRLRS